MLRRTGVTLKSFIKGKELKTMLQRTGANLKSFITANKELVILSIFFLFYLVLVAVWLIRDNSDLSWDPAAYYVNSLQYFKAIRSLSLPDMALIEGKNWPPFPMFFIALFYFLGKTPDVAILIQTSIFLPILLFSVYTIGRKLLNKNAALLASFITAVYPATFFYSRKLVADLPLTAMVSLSLCFLLLTDGFQNRKYSLLFGLVLGLGFLSKLTYPMFVIGPAALIVLYSIYSLIKRRRTSSASAAANNTPAIKDVKEEPRSDLRNRIINITSALAIAAVLIAIWYVPYWDDIMRNIKSNVSYTAGLHVPAFFALSENASFPLLVFSAVAFVYLIVAKPREPKKVAFLLLWILIPCIVYSFQSNQQPRYIMPTIPALALLSAIFVDKIKFRNLKVGLITRVVLITLVIIFGLTFIISRSIDEPLWRLYTVKVGSSTFEPLPSAASPKGRNFKIDEALLIINESITSDKKNSIVGIPHELTPALMSHIGLHNVEHDELPMEVVRYVQRPGEIDNNLIIGANFILYLVDTETGRWKYPGQAYIEEHHQFREGLSQIQDYLEDNSSVFKDIGKVELGGNEELVIYKNTFLTGEEVEDEKASLAGEDVEDEKASLAGKDVEYENGSLAGDHVEGRHRAFIGDLHIIDIVSDATLHGPGDEMTVHVTVINLGRVTHHFSIQIYLDVPGGEVPWKEPKDRVIRQSSATIDIAPGESMIVPIHFLVFNKIGEYDLGAGAYVRNDEGIFKYSDLVFLVKRINVK